MCRPERPFGKSVVLTFVATVIVSLVTQTLPQETCVPGAEYAVTGTFTCLACPDHGTCDGTSAVNVEPGNWRANLRSFTFYPCDPPSACPSATHCSTGYEGPLCSRCEPSFGKSGSECLACYDVATNIAMVALFFAALVALIYVLSIRSMPFSAFVDQKITAADHAKKQPFSILFKIVMSHLQIIGAVPYKDLAMPAWINSFFTVANSGSSFNPNLSFVACLFGQGAVTRLWVTVALAPLLAAVYACLFDLLCAAPQRCLHPGAAERSRG